MKVEADSSTDQDVPDYHEQPEQLQALEPQGQLGPQQEQQQQQQYAQYQFQPLHHLHPQQPHPQLQHRLLSLQTDQKPLLPPFEEPPARRATIAPVPIPRNPSTPHPLSCPNTPPTDTTTAPSAPNGPLSKPVVLPPRAKPGRRPMPDSSATDRRRLQNRVAQRNHRDKRQQKVADLEAHLHEKKQQHNDTLSELLRERENERFRHREALDAATARATKLESQLLKAQQEIRQLRGRLDSGATDAAPANPLNPSATLSFPYQQTASSIPAFRAYSARSTQQGPYSGLAGMTPPEDTDADATEIDFTTYRAPRKDTNAPSAARPSLSAPEDSHESSYTINEASEHCGFCTDSGNCACALDALNSTTTAPAAAVKSQTPAIQPGSCDSCMNDPARQAACRAIASQATPQPAQNGTAPPPPPQTTGMIHCSQFMDNVQLTRPRQSLPSIVEMLQGSVTAYGSTTTGFQVSEREAAEALSALASHTGAVKLRPMRHREPRVKEDREMEVDHVML